MSATELRVPLRFWQDHASRSDDTELAEPIRTTTREAVVRLSAEQLADLESDARHYAEMGALGAFERDLAGLVASARATIRRIEAAR